MHLADYFDVSRIRINIPIQSKKRLLEFASEIIADSSDDMNPRAIYSQMCARESIGSTGLGSGIAIPHGRVPESDQTLGAIIRLQEPVDFNASDKIPIDLVICLALPENHEQRHLNLLSLIAEFLHDEENQGLLRQAETADVIMEQLNSWEPSQ